MSKEKYLVQRHNLLSEPGFTREMVKKSSLCAALALAVQSSYAVSPFPLEITSGEGVSSPASIETLFECVPDSDKVVVTGTVLDMKHYEVIHPDFQGGYRDSFFVITMGYQGTMGSTQDSIDVVVEDTGLPLSQWVGRGCSLRFSTRSLLRERWNNKLVIRDLISPEDLKLNVDGDYIPLVPVEYSSR